MPRLQWLMFHMPMSSPQRIRMFGCFVAIFSLLLVEIDCLCRASDKTRIHRFFEACNHFHARLGPTDGHELGLVSLIFRAHFRRCWYRGGISTSVSCPAYRRFSDISEDFEWALGLRWMQQELGISPR